MHLITKFMNSSKTLFYHYSSPCLCGPIEDCKRGYLSVLRAIPVTLGLVIATQVSLISRGFMRTIHQSCFVRDAACTVIIADYLHRLAREKPLLRLWHGKFLANLKKNSDQISQLLDGLCRSHHLVWFQRVSAWQCRIFLNASLSPNWVSLLQDNWVCVWQQTLTFPET